MSPHLFPASSARSLVPNSVTSDRAQPERIQRQFFVAPFEKILGTSSWYGEVLNDEAGGAPGVVHHCVIDGSVRPVVEEEAAVEGRRYPGGPGGRKVLDQDVRRIVGD